MQLIVFSVTTEHTKYNATIYIVNFLPILLGWAFSAALYSCVLTVCFVLACHLYGWPTEILILKQKKKS